MIKLFKPKVTAGMRQAVTRQLKTYDLTQGKMVEKFEKKFSEKFGLYPLALNSGTSALELAYHLLDLKPGDEVITPVFSCTATNLPLVRRGVKIVFADVKDNLMLDWRDAEKRVTKKTKAIINVHLWGEPNNHLDWSIPVVNDSAQYMGKHQGRFSTYSFQAVKIMTTIDGGMLVCENSDDYLRGKLLRWYGIDREAGIPNIDVDITEAGYKYHMNDVTAAMGVAGLKDLEKLRAHRKKLEKAYFTFLKGTKVIPIGGSAPFLAHVDKREAFRNKLYLKGIETGLGHRRNDQYTVFGGRQKFEHMDAIEHKYVLLPLHNNMSVRDVDYICSVIKEGW